MSDSNKFKKPHWNVYKPLPKADSGAAFQFSYDSGKGKAGAIFLEAAKQKGPKLPIGDPKQFDWENKIVFKIGIADIAKLLQFFNGRVKDVECLHSDREKGRTSVLSIGTQEYQGRPTFPIKLSRKQDGENQFVNMFLNVEEVGVLAHFMRESLTRMMGFE